MRCSVGGETHIGQVRPMRLTVQWLAVLVLLGQTRAAAAECPRLRPVHSRFAAWHRGSDYEYDAAVSRTLFGHEKRTRDLQMIRFDPHLPEEAVYVIDQNESEPGAANAKKPQHVVVHVRAEKQIRQEAEKRRQAARVRARISRAPADVRLVGALQKLWKAAILQARFVENEHIETRFDTYEFSSFVGLGTATAYANGRISGSCLDELVAVGIDLGSYTRLPAQKQREASANLVRRAEALLTRLDSELRAKKP